MGLFMANEQILYAVIEVATGDFTWLRYGRSYDPEGEAPTPQVNDGYVLVRMQKPDLEGLTERQFLSQKKAVVVNGAFSHWILKNLPHQMVVSENPKADMSNSPEVLVSGGTPGSSVKISFSRPVDCSLPETSPGSGDFTLVLDGAGDGTFKFRVAGLGPLRISTCCSGTRPASLDVTVESGSFD